MTAIKEFERLEALGLWRETHDAQRREVVISFGEASLVLSDINNSPLAHWSLAAIDYKGSSDNGSIFSVDELGEETLEIDDPTMIAAIGKIRASIDATRPHPGRLRWFISALTLLVFLGFSLFWLPNALTKYAASIVPDTKATQIGDSLIKSIQKTTGSVCSTPAGERALRRFESRVIGNPSSRVRILEMGTRPSVHLPGGNILLNHRLTTQSSDANLLAGYTIMERAAEEEETPLLDLFDFIGIRKTLGFLGTGDISETDIEAFADWRLFGPQTKPELNNLLELFKQAKVPFSAYAIHAKDDDLMRAKDLEDAQFNQILSDNDWINLQEICGD